MKNEGEEGESNKMTPEGGQHIIRAKTHEQSFSKIARRLHDVMSAKRGKLLFHPISACHGERLQLRYTFCSTGRKFKRARILPTPFARVKLRKSPRVGSKVYSPSPPFFFPPKNPIDNAPTAQIPRFDDPLHDPPQNVTPPVRRNIP